MNTRSILHYSQRVKAIAFHMLALPLVSWFFLGYTACTYTLDQEKRRTQVCTTELVLEDIAQALNPISIEVESYS